MGLFFNRKVDKKQQRLDRITDEETGQGTDRDKVYRGKPQEENMPDDMAIKYFQSEGFVDNIVSGFAEDAVKEWITITTNKDNEKQIGRLIENRLYELGVREKIKELITFSRAFHNGGCIYLGMETAGLQETLDLSKEVKPDQLSKIAFINVIEGEKFTVSYQTEEPLKADYNQIVSIKIKDTPVHKSRVKILNFSRIGTATKSAIESCINPVRAQSDSLWSIHSLIKELAVKKFKSPAIKDLNKTKIFELANKIKNLINTQSVMMLADDEDYTKDTYQAGGVGESLTFIWESLAGVSRMPKARIMGNSQGVISAGQFDSINYFENIMKFLESEVRPIIEWIIEFVIQESSGEIKKVLGSDVFILDWNIEFKELWSLDPSTKRDVELKTVQKLTTLLDKGVLTPDEVRKELGYELENFDVMKNIDYETNPEVKNGVPITLGNTIQ